MATTEKFPFELEPGERVLWSGTPRTGVVFGSSDVLQVPISVVIMYVFVTQLRIASFRGPVDVLLALAIFIAVMYFAVGRFLFDAYCRRKTAYALTSERMLVRESALSDFVKSFPLNTITARRASTSGRTIAAVVVGATLCSFGCRNADKPAAVSAAAAVPVRPDSAAQTPPAAATSPWTVTDSGAGPLRIGMTRDQLALDLHAQPPKRTKADSGCAYLEIDGIPKGMRTMWIAATLARIEIVAPGFRTDRGAQVGDALSRIDSLYQGSMTAMPAKYDPRGKYLVVRPAAGLDSSRRIVFETDSTRHVTRYRVGREPEVEWVEGCS
ncbi:MAG: hypothetical protein ABI889_12745 [Gemmatimonadota bacterium]